MRCGGYVPPFARNKKLLWAVSGPLIFRFGVGMQDGGAESRQKNPPDRSRGGVWASFGRVPLRRVGAWRIARLGAVGNIPGRDERGR